jgi:hypothetical protein
MHDLNIRDTRLPGPRPSGNEVLEVDANTPLSWPISWVASRSAKYAGDVRVRLMAHGIEIGMVAAGVVMDSPLRSHIQRNRIQSQGGWGLEFCAQNLTLDTLKEFSPWYGKVRQIDILGCGIAYITPGREGKAGDGNLLCYRLAQITGSYVRASTAAQNYVGMDFGPWEGTVITYAPTGAPGVPPFP